GVRNLEQLEPVVERGRSDIEVVDENIARGLGDDFALHQLARFLAQQGGLLFQDGGRRGQVGVGNVRRPKIVAVRHRALLQNFSFSVTGRWSDMVSLSGCPSSCNSEKSRIEV